MHVQCNRAHTRPRIYVSMRTRGALISTVPREGESEKGDPTKQALRRSRLSHS